MISNCCSSNSSSLMLDNCVAFNFTVLVSNDILDTGNFYSIQSVITLSSNL